MSRSLNLGALRATIDQAPATGTAATVTRRFLEQVEQELRAGRAAQVQLQVLAGMGAVIDSLQSGARA